MINARDVMKLVHMYQENLSPYFKGGFLFISDLVSLSINYCHVKHNFLLNTVEVILAYLYNRSQTSCVIQNSFNDRVVIGIRK